MVYILYIFYYHILMGRRDRYRSDDTPTRVANEDLPRLQIEDTPVSSSRRQVRPPRGSSGHEHKFGFYRPLEEVVGLEAGMQAVQIAVVNAGNILSEAGLDPYRP